MPLTILIVEDLPEFRDSLARMVAEAPDMWLVAAVGTLAAGRECLDRAPIDILLVDLGLPDGSGLELILEARRRWGDGCDIMVISVFADAAHVMDALKAGATGYLHKDSPPDDWLRQIRELAAGGSPISPIIARQVLRRLGTSPSPEGGGGKAIQQGTGGAPPACEGLYLR